MGYAWAFRKSAGKGARRPPLNPPTLPPFPVVYFFQYECPEGTTMNRAIFLPGIVLVLFLAAVPAQAETRIMIVLDASGSMSAPGSTRTGSTKLSEVSTALTVLLQKLPETIAQDGVVVGQHHADGRSGGPLASRLGARHRRAPPA